jgi:hypothetical protein
LGAASLADELVAPAARARLERLSSWGPRAAHFAAFECRLDGRDARVDVSCALEGRRARAVVRHWLRTQAAALVPHAYQACRDLLVGWAADQGVLSELGSLWIEVDLEPGGPERPFVYARPEHAGQFWQRGDADRVRPLLAAWAEASGGALQPGSATRLAACIAALPAGARVLLLAPQLRARANAIRMSFRLSADRLLSYLAQIAWPGRRDLLAELLHSCAAQHWAMPIQLDVIDGEVSPTLSLEFMQSRDNGYGERCEPLLAGWVARGLCTAPKAAALLAWRREDAHELVPALGVDKLIDLKLTLASDGRASAKAYLGTLAVNRYFTQAEAPGFARAQDPATRSLEP